jgi:16S rRNA (adenine1518-N6/adenine1519-N6)-dimethyltransferase
MATKPKLGQNFLIDPSASLAIVEALGDISAVTVLEIGPGKGEITKLLASRARRLIAVELDTTLADTLQEEFPKVEVLLRDILATDISSLVQNEKLSVVGNLPYYITSPILLKLAAAHASIDFAVLMVQREVADRITASPGSRDYGLLSVTVQMFGSADPLFTLPPHAFTPPPDVHSTVFRWRFAPRFIELGVLEAPFLRFVRQAFAQKRKTLANNLRAAGFAPPAIAAALAQAAPSPQARAEQLSIENLATLYRALWPQSGS